MAKAPRIDPTLLKSPLHLLALGFGAGLSPKAPGTVGSLLALVPAWLMLNLSWPSQLAIALAICGLGVFICGASARELGVHDHPGIVFDEIAAMLLLVPLIPDGAGWLLAGFVLFRAFDIGKPWPIRDIDHRMTGGAGIMLDDLIAALYTALSLQIVHILHAVA